MRTCDDCGAPVSNWANQCMKCGSRNYNHAFTRNVIIIVLMALAIFVGMIAGLNAR